jgi:AcrR family transcriptional regulator
MQELCMKALAKRKPTDHLERLLDAAEELFEQEGFLHFTTDELAQRLRCSKRALYAIAAGREKLFEVVLQRRNARLEESLFAQIERAPDTETALHASVEAIVGSLEDLSPIYLRDIFQFPPGVRMVKGFQRKLADAIARAIKRGERENLFRRLEPRVVAEALLASINRMIQTDFLTTSPVSAAQAVQQVFQIFWCGLCRNESAPSKGRQGRVSARKNGSKLSIEA